MDSDRPLAAVTGASSGIGFELAKQFAINGFDLIIAAEDAGLDQAEQELRSFGANVEAVRVDLATESGVEDLYDSLRGRMLAAAALNAGVGQGGAFAHSELRDDGDERVVSASLATKAQGRFSRALPDRVKAGMHRRMAEPGSGD